MSNPGISNTSNPAIPTTAQLTEARIKQWHQQGEALLTIENLRSWINAAGLVLFVPRPQITAPAPSFVEAVIGAPNSSPTVNETSAARSLLARLVAEGLAVPLNLLGSASGVVGEMPDFVASSAVFSYIFTLRGDKAWKQPPATSGPTKISNLALAIHEALSRRGPLTAYDLSTEVGKEVTEAAVLRALGELWMHLRVLPLTQPDDQPTTWELTSARLTKQIKAGANAGQPTALSALISLYLGQAVAASEDEIESFLSPLAPRSRIRDVVHALLATRQLDTLAIEGRTLVHVAGQSPSFEPEKPSLQEELPADGAAPERVEDGGDAERITKYVPKPRKVGTGYLAKAKPAKLGAKPDFKRSGPPSDRERRPFNKSRPSGARRFDKPWEEEKVAPAQPSRIDEAGEVGSRRAADQRYSKPYRSRPEGGSERRDKPGFGGKQRFGGKPSFGNKSQFRGEGRPPRRDFETRSAGGSDDARPSRKGFSKPSPFGRKREGFGGKPAFGGESRPPRADFGPRTDSDNRRSSDRPRREGETDFRPRKSFDSKRQSGSGFKGRSDFSRDRSEGKSREGGERFTETESGKRVYRKFDAPREGGNRRPRTEGPGGFGGKRPSRGFSESKSQGGRADSTGRPSGGFSKKFGKPAGKKPFGKPGGGSSAKPSGTFAKFVGNKKPFGDRPPARKFKPKEGESA